MKSQLRKSPSGGVIRSQSVVAGIKILKPFLAHLYKYGSLRASSTMIRLHRPFGGGGYCALRILGASLWKDAYLKVETV